MKTALVYATKSGASKTCAMMIADYVGNCDLLDIATPQKNLQHYDRIILGTGVRVGRPYRPMRSFMKKNLALLSEKQIWIYFCNVNVEGFPKMVEKYVPEELRHTAKSLVSFGGKPPVSPKDIDTASWLDEAALHQFLKEVTVE